MADTRKTDRRTVYTKKAIGDAFLRAKRNKDYNTITVAEPSTRIPAIFRRYWTPCWMIRSPIWIICGIICPRQTPVPDRNVPIHSAGMKNGVQSRI